MIESIAPTTSPTQTQPQSQGFTPEVQEYVAKLNRLQSVAPMFGYDQRTVDRFVTQKRAEVLSAGGLGIGEISTDPILQGVQAQQLVSGTYKPGKPVDDALTQAYIEQLKSGSLPKITNILQPEERSAVVRSLSEQGINITELERNRAGQTVAGIGRQLHDIFETQGLAGGRFLGQITRAGRVAGAAPQATRYEDLRKAAIASFRELTGDKGVLTETDAQRLIGMIPTVTNTPKEASLKWLDMDQFIRNKYGVGLFEDEELLKLQMTTGETSKKPQTAEGQVTVGGYIMEIE